MTRQFSIMFKGAAALVVASSLLAGAVCASSTPGIARSKDVVVTAVDRAGKGDRLPLRNNLNRSGTSLPATRLFSGKPPIGCESVFSPIADPGRAHVLGRCMS
jgi:hypothetical protein